MSVRPRPFADLTDVTLADEDSNSIPTDNANRAIQGNVASATWWPTLQLMQVTPSSGKICNLCQWRHLMAISAPQAAVGRSSS